MLYVVVIRPGINPFSCPMLLMQNKDSGWHFYVDYCALNKLTIPDKFLIPIFDELLDELFGVTILTKLDLKFEYHQIQMIDNDIEKTAFKIHNEHYEFLVMPFSLSNTLTTFQDLMNEVF